MSTDSGPSYGRRDPTSQEQLGIRLVSILLFLIGVSALGYFIFATITNDEVQASLEDPEYFGLGAEAVLVEPEATVENQAHFALRVEDGARAAELGLQDGDILQSVNGTAIDATELDIEALDEQLAAAFSSASAEGIETIAVEVYRDGAPLTEPILVPLPEYEFLFELRVPSADTASLGLSIDYMEALSLEPYYAIIPEPGGPADREGIREGDRLVRVLDAVDVGAIMITPDLDEDLVNELIREENIARDEDDFIIEVEVLRETGRGEFSSQEYEINKQLPPTFVLAYLDNVGFILPITSIGIGILLLSVGRGLWRRELSAARWAEVSFLWLAIGSVLVGLQQFWSVGRGGIISTEPFDFGEGLSAALPFIVLVIPVAIGFWWLGRVGDDIFIGEEGLTDRNTRFAWSLLVPTLAVLIVVAARPLEQTFFASLTDNVFGASRPARFVGLDNYQKLLSVEFAVVDCQIDEETNECARTEGGQQAILWERSELEEEERRLFRELSSEERLSFNRYEPAFTIPMGIFGENQGFRILGRDFRFLQSFANTMQFTIASVFLELILGMIIALVVNTKFVGRGLMRTAMLVPWAIPTVVGAVLWEVILRPNNTGIFNVMMQDLGFIDSPESWLSATGPWLTAIIAIDVWKTAPFMALLLLAGLQTIPGDVYEAADVDGASKFRQFWAITLPLLRPTIAVALVFRTLDALRAFDVFQVLLDPSRPSMALYNFDRLVNGQLTGYSSAIGVLIFVLILIFTVIYVRFVGIDTQ